MPGFPVDGHIFQMCCHFCLIILINIMVCFIIKICFLLFLNTFLILRDGRLRVNDQIIRINGRSLEGLQHNDAIKLLQAEQGAIELVVLRDCHTPGHTSNLQSPQSPLALTNHTTERTPTSATSSSSASSALTTPLTAASTSSETSQKTFKLPQTTPSPAAVTSANVRRPQPPRMSKHPEDAADALPFVRELK